MLLSDNIKMSAHTVRQAKLRSTLTLLGIIVGVVAFVLIVGLGEGFKHQVNQQLSRLGNNIITIQPGQTVNRNTAGLITSASPLAFLNTGSLSEQDLSLVQQTTGIKSAVPLSISPAVIDTDNGGLPNVPVIATGGALPDILGQKIMYGGFFSNDETNKNVAILGKNVAMRLYKENVPLGQTFRIRGQEFLVRGVFDSFPLNPFSPTTDFNNAIFIPFGAAKATLGTLPIPLILASASDVNQINSLAANLTVNLKTAHGGQTDFTILKQDENVATESTILRIITALIAGMATIAVLMGGVGIMNTMLVAVTERTREIGIRKAIGATNRQILSQFLIEAVILSLSGMVIGILVALLAIFIIRVLTPLEPIITWWSIGIATGSVLLIGVVFGIMPAIKAARKDPIDALRYE